MVNKFNAHVYYDGIGNVCFQVGDLHLEVVASALLTDIYSVIEFDNTGYIVINTNYGEEFYDLSEILGDLNLSRYYCIEDLMSRIKLWEIGGKKSMQKRGGGLDSIRANAVLIVSNIAFGIRKDANFKKLRAIDLNNTRYMADFIFDNQIRRFRMIESSFSDGKRKYEMLYLLERNTEELMEAYAHA